MDHSECEFRRFLVGSCAVRGLLARGLIVRLGLSVRWAHAASADIQMRRAQNVANKFRRMMHPVILMLDRDNLPFILHYTSVSNGTSGIGALILE